GLRGGDRFGSREQPSHRRHDGPRDLRTAPSSVRDEDGRLLGTRGRRSGSEDAADRISGGADLVPDLAQQGSSDPLFALYQNRHARDADRGVSVDSRAQSGGLVRRPLGPVRLAALGGRCATGAASSLNRRRAAETPRFREGAAYSGQAAKLSDY